jgi:plasmid stability protein
MLLASDACVAYSDRMQYTIRGIPPEVDEAVRERAKAEGKSLNDVAVEALAEGLGVSGEDRVRRDLSDVAGSWKRDVGTEAALTAQDEVDEGLWR